MPFGVWSIMRIAAFGLATALVFGAAPARAATPYLVADADTGQVLIENQATADWYPASLTKLMTVYVALDAVRDGRLTMDTPLVVSARAAAHAAFENGLPARHRGDARQRAQDADGEVAQRSRRDRRRGHLGFGRRPSRRR